MKKHPEAAPKPVVLGLSHRTTDVAIRDRAALREDVRPAVRRDLLASVGIDECVVLSTCNRIEVYVAAQAPEAAATAILEVWCAHADVSTDELAAHSYQHQGTDAIRHLFRVACSLESLVLGESQISGQVKEAYAESREARQVKFHLDHLFRDAIHAAKRVRSETAICEGAVSISFAAVKLAEKVLGDLSKKRVGIIGSGEMGELAARHFAKAGVHDFIVFNRSRGRAERLASRFGAPVCLLEEMETRLAECDVVLSATNAPGVVLDHDAVARAVRKRRGRPLFLIDIAAPSDIASAAGELESVFLFTIDDLKEAVRENAEKRRAAAEEASQIVETCVAEAEQWHKGLDVRPVIRELREKYERMMIDELTAIARHADEAERARLEFLSRSILNKFLHHPMTGLRRLGAEGHGQAAAHYATQLFDLGASVAPGGEDPPHA